MTADVGFAQSVESLGASAKRYGWYTTVSQSDIINLVNEMIGAALAKLSADAFLSAVKAAWSYRQGGAAKIEQRQAELTEAYELALRLLGSVLFETRANIERVRMMVEKASQNQTSVGILDFTVSEALMPEFCRIVTTPHVLESCRTILAMLKRVDFFQRGAVHNQNLYRRGAAYADDCMDKQIIERFNALLQYAQKVAAAVFESGDGDAHRGILFPAPIAPQSPIDGALL